MLSAFQMSDSSGTVHSMLMMRNPWGTTNYTSLWSKDDTNWTDELVAQVPLSIDPRTSHASGIFVVPLEKLGPQTGGNHCFASFAIAHYRESSGYASTFYDRENADQEDELFLKVTAGTNDGDLYFVPDLFPQEVVPDHCFGGTYTFDGDTFTNEL